MDSTHAASDSHRHPDRWNTVPVPDRVAQRAITRVVKQDDGCWISAYSIGTHGYAQIGWQDANVRGLVLAHKAAWVAVNGQVPMAMTLDHTCKVRPCVNPDHLRLLPNIENARRNQGDDFPMGGCRHGHPNTDLMRMARRTKSGERRWGVTCRQCMRDSQARWVAANPEKRREATKRYDDKRKAA